MVLCNAPDRRPGSDHMSCQPWSSGTAAPGSHSSAAASWSAHASEALPGSWRRRRRCWSFLASIMGARRRWSSWPDMGAGRPQRAVSRSQGGVLRRRAQPGNQFPIPSYPSRYCKAKCASLRVPATHGAPNLLKIFMYFIHFESSDIVENGGANLPAAGEILGSPDFITWPSLNALYAVLRFSF